MVRKPDLMAIADEVIQKTVAALPPEIASELEHVSVFVEDVPTADDVERGIGADWLGIFEGASHNHVDIPEPPRIRIWVENLWSFAEEHEEWFRDEVRITLLHEIAHYLDLDEEDVAERGLE